MGTLSLCLIMRDEEKNIERCLKSVFDIVDEMIVVDTGSKDNSIAIAKSLGAQVFNYTWENDFAKAKNYAISKARGDWLLFLDADDELVDLDMIRPLMEETDYDGFLFLTLSFLGRHPGEDIVQNPQVKLVQNREDIRYRRAIHEVILTEPNRKVALVPIRVYHYGYLDQKDNIKKKISRNKEILLAQAKDSLDFFYLGSEYMRESNWSKALEYFSQAKLNAPEIAKKKAFALIQLEEYEKALNTLDEALKEFPDYTDLWFLKGSIYQTTGQYSKALDAYTSCLSLGEAPPHYPTDLGVGSYQAYLYLGITEESLMNFPEAKEAYLKALGINPKYQTALRFLIRLVTNYPELNGTLPEIPVSLALEARAYDLALKLAKDPLSRGLAYLGKREYHQALRELEKVDNPLSIHHQVLIYWILGEFAKAEALLDPLTSPLHQVILGQEELPDYDFLLQFMEKSLEVGGSLLVKKVYLNLKDYYPDLSDALREMANRYGDTFLIPEKPVDFFASGAYLVNQKSIGLARLYTSYHQGYRSPQLYHFLALGLTRFVNLDFPRVVVDL